jgi:GR25 family glycosyltransferase involved in LPS biosynthesis
MNKYLDFFDSVFYINLDSRQDRDIKFKQRAKELDIPAIRVSGIIPEDDQVKPIYDGHVDARRKYKIGCTLSHKEIIQIAKKNELSNCLIFEDDCVFLDTYRSDIEKCINDLKDIEWDLFYMGGQPNNYCVKLTDNLSQIKNGGVYCTHAYAINKSFYDKFLSIDELKIDTIDIALINMSDDYRKAILSKKIMALQDVTYSDLWDAVKDSNDIIIESWNKFVL